MGVKLHRGFESRPLRFSGQMTTATYGYEPSPLWSGVGAEQMPGGSRTAPAGDGRRALVLICPLQRADADGRTTPRPTGVRPRVRAGLAPISGPSYPYGCAALDTFPASTTPDRRARVLRARLLYLHTR